MTSSINPNNIDGAYPVAGQDNDSQGFRDNFTNTKTNFGYAKDEITDLQSKAVLKSALIGTTLNNNMNNSVLSNAQFVNISEPIEAFGLTTGSITLSFSLSPYYTLTTSGAITLGFDNSWPSAGQVGRIRFQINVQSVAHTLELPPAVSVGVSNLQGYNPSNDTITFNQIGIYEFEFETSNGGAAISIFDLNRNRDPLYLPSSEDLASTSAANLALTTSYFSTAAAETATLAAGSPGQVKIFAMYANAGNMVITVTNAGWKATGTGTITFTDIGQTATLMYINSKWFVTGQGAGVGDTFATFA
jgi:hypothetical protein